MKKFCIYFFIIIYLVSLLFLVGCEDKDSISSTPANDDTDSNSSASVKLEIPKFSKGVIDVCTYDENTTLLVSVGSTTDDFENYCDKLENIGLKKVFSRKTNELLCSAYFNGDEYIYAYYAVNTCETRVITGPKGEFSKTDCSIKSEFSVKPSLTMVGQPSIADNGQGFIFVLPDGRLIIQDGGSWYKASDNKDIIYKAIKEVAPNPEKIVIAAWFISHPHSDHIGAFQEYLAFHSYDESIKLESVICNFASADRYNYTRSDGGTEDCGALITDMISSLELYTPTTEIIKAHTGQIFDFGNVKAEILFTVEDLLPVNQFDYVNSTSLVVRFHIAEQSILLLADTTHKSGMILEMIYADTLKSDMVQIAHHGMWPGHPSLYNLIKAPVLLWPNNSETAKEWQTDSAVAAALSYAKKVYIADNKLTTLPLPYKY